jgi:hypothetical protein
MKIKLIYNNANKLDRLLSNGHPLLSHLGQIEIEMETVYNNTIINRLLSLSPPHLCLVDFLARGGEPLIPTSPLAVTIPSKTYT